MRNLSLFDLAFLARAAATDRIIDDFEEYTAGDSLDGLNGGTGWGAAWDSHDGAAGLLSMETFEEYADGGLNGENGGLGWSAAWVSRDSFTGLLASEDFESYALGGLNGENGGTGWNGAWVSR